jgi:hypothetical protein
MATPKKKETPDDKITQLLELVERQKAAIAEAERPVFRTNRTFSYVDGDLSKSVNLAVVSDVGALLKMAAHVSASAYAYKLVTMTEDSIVTREAVSHVASSTPCFETTACTKPDPSRSCKNAILPEERTLCAQPFTVTVSPTWEEN